MKELFLGNKAMSKHLFRKALVLTFLILSASSCLASQTLAELFQKSRQQGKFIPVSSEEADKAEALFESLFKGECQQKDWSMLDYTIKNIEENGNHYQILAETEDKKRGRGFFVFQMSLNGPIMLQIPHSHHDKHTGTIAINMLQNGLIKVAALNTVPRIYKKEGNLMNSDMAHLEHSYFVAITKAFAKVFPNGKIVQLHGFDVEKRKTDNGKYANVITSSGSNTPKSWVVNFTECLQNKFEETIYLYPRDIKELGGINSIIAKTLQIIGHPGFLHIEMDIPFRENLLKDDESLNKLMGCLNAARDDSI